MVAKNASRREKKSEPMNASLSKNATYQRSENPSGGKARNSPAFTEASTTMTSGVRR